MKTISTVVILSLLAASCSQVSRHPTDEALIQNFTIHKAEFQELVAMIQADKGLRRIDDNWTDPSDPSTVGVPPERIVDYRKRFAVCGIPRGFYSFQAGSNINFIATAFGLCTGGSGKGYAFLSTPPLPSDIVSSTDDYRTNRRGAYRVYRHVEGNWYIEYDFDD
jgi:hypothetical protein